MDLSNYFPFRTIREKQKFVLKEIEDSISSGIKHIFFEAPTGFGKSPIAIALATYFGNSHICTSTIDLQDQYTRDFPFINEVKGKRNFICILQEQKNNVSETCEYGPCQKEDEFDCEYKTKLMEYTSLNIGTKQENIFLENSAKSKYLKKFNLQTRFGDLEWKPCDYYHQKWIAIKSSHTIYNYKYLLSDIYFSNNIKKRNLFIFDEAHNLESEISDFKSFTIYNDNIVKLFPNLSLPQNRAYEIETWLDFCEEYRDNLLEFIDQAEIEIENGRIREPFTEKNLIDSINREKNLSQVINDIKLNNDNWLVTNIHKLHNDSINKITITPLDVSNYFNELLEYSSYNLFMSATILSKDYLCKVTGLDPSEIKFIQIKESDFPKKNRPIYLMNIAWLNNKNMELHLPLITKTVNNILSIHKNEKGIIHTTSYYQLNYIKNSISKENSNRLIETDPLISRSDVLNKHYNNKKPSVLISPSLQQGLDLKDDLSRFQIIIKVPYLDLSDKKISTLKNRDPNWYMWNTVIRLSQAYGRSVRNKDDHASTYILDSNITYLLKHAPNMFPIWFKEAIIKR